MEIVLIGFGVAFVLLVAYWAMRESDEDRRGKEKAKERMREIQAERARQTAAAYDRQRHPTHRSAPVTTGKPKNDAAQMGFLRGSENSRPYSGTQTDNFVDTYTAPTYSSSHSTSSYSSHSCSSSSSSSSDSSSSSSDSGGGGCD